MLLRVIIGGLIGAGLGAIMGYFGQCSSGTCPLTSTWWRGAITHELKPALRGVSWVTTLTVQAETKAGR